MSYLLQVIILKRTGYTLKLLSQPVFRAKIGQRTDCVTDEVRSQLNVTVGGVRENLLHFLRILFISFNSLKSKNFI